MEVDVTMAYSFQVTFDCVDPHVLAEWWAEALGWTVEPSDPEFIRRMIAEGHATPADTREHRGALVWKDGAAINHPDDPTGPGGAASSSNSYPRPRPSRTGSISTFA